MAKWLRRLGPTWRAAPLRRIVQTICLGVFLGLFFYVAWPYSDRFSARTIPDKQWLPLESFLWIDPLVGLSTAVAARAWNVALVGMAVILFVCVLWPRGFCGYVCPLGTMIDLFDWVVGKVRGGLQPNGGRVRPSYHLGGRPQSAAAASRNNHSGRAEARPSQAPAARTRWWMNLKYYILAGVLVASAFGVLLSGYVSAIPVLTRGLMFSAGQLQLGLMKNWGQVAPLTPAVCVSLALFAAVFLLGLIHPRFWCRYVCPSGAMFSAFNLLRVGERKVESTCIECNKCVQACPFDAIREDFTTRELDCTFCQTCGGVCPTESIKFSWHGLPARDDGTVPPTPPSAEAGQPCAEPGPPTSAPAALSPLPPERSMSRRRVVLSMIGGAAAAMCTRAASHAGPLPLRPPGSVDEQRFLDLCIRCGECFKVCPGPVLHPAGLAGGLEGLWTPIAVPTHAGCHQDCNFCTLVCPTHAIVPLTIAAKRKTAMGLAVFDPALCLPHRGERDCRLCYDECAAAGYHAIEMRKIALKTGDIPEGAVSDDEREEMSRINAPFIRADLCTGCGLCEYRCNGALVRQRPILPRRAVVVIAEDRRRPARVLR
ncbi:MAG: 4Fe-4S binding protein [Tepidisphaerales bacterium]